MYKTSVSTFLYFNYTLEDAIKSIAEVGYDAVEIWGGRPHAYAGDYSPSELAELKKLIESQGLELSGFIPAQFRYPTNLSLGWDKVWQASVDYLKRSIETAAELGSPLVSICPGHSLSDQTVSQARGQFQKAMEILRDFTGEDGPELLIEPAHPYESDVIPDVPTGIDFIEKLNRDRVGLVIDTGHVNVNGIELLNYSGKLEKIPLHIHIDDNQGQQDQHLIPGEGNIDFSVYRDFFERVNYQGYLTAEIGFGYTLNSEEAAENCLAQLKSIFE